MWHCHILYIVEAKLQEWLVQKISSDGFEVAERGHELPKKKTSVAEDSWKCSIIRVEGSLCCLLYW